MLAVGAVRDAERTPESAGHGAYEILYRVVSENWIDDTDLTPHADDSSRAYRHDRTGLLTADPARDHDDEKSELHEISHLASLPGILQVVAQQFDPVFGHYGITIPDGSVIWLFRDGQVASARCTGT